MIKLVLYFDSHRTRNSFISDVSDLIFWQDNQRDQEDRCFYEDLMQFALPDIQGYDPQDPDSSANRLTYSQAAIAADPSNYVHLLESVPMHQSVD